MHGILKKFELFFFLILFFLTVVAGYFQLSPEMENGAVAFRQALRVRHGNPGLTSFPKEKIQLLILDDAFYRKYGAWPVRRGDLARLVENLHTLGAEVIVCDLFLAYPSIYGDDDRLAKTLRKISSVVLASRLVYEPGRGLKLHTPDHLFKESAQTGYTLPLHVSPPRRSPVTRFNIYSSLAHSHSAFPLALVAVSSFKGGGLVFSNGVLSLNGRRLDDSEVFIDFSQIPEAAGSLSGYAGVSADQYLHIDAKKLAQIEELKSLVSGKIVIIGDNSQVALSIFHTPVGMMHSSEVLAEQIKTLLRGAHPRPAPAAVEALYSFAFLFPLLLCCRFFRGLKASILAVMILYGIFGFLNVFFYVSLGMMVSMSYPFLAGLAGVMGIRLKMGLEDRAFKNQFYIRLQEKLDDALKKYRNIYDNSEEGFFRILPDQKLVGANGAMAKMLGYRSELEFLRNLSGNFSQCCKDPERMEKLLEQARREGQAREHEARLVRKDGSTIWASLSLRAISGSNDSTACFEGSLLDISMKKQLDTLIETERIDREILSHVCRRIRMKAAPIANICALALDSDPGSSDNPRIKAIGTYSAELLDYTDKIEDFVKIQLGEMERQKEEFSLPDVLEWSMDAHKEMAANRGIELILDMDREVPNTLKGNKAQLEQILDILVEHAIRSIQSPRLVYEIRLLEASEDMLELMFVLTESEEPLPRSERISRFESAPPLNISEENIDDHGRGELLICKRVVEWMGGEIRGGKQGKNDCEYIFTLCFERSDRPKQDRPKISGELESMRVLVADDDPRSLRVLESLLKDYHFQPTCVQSAKEAYEALDGAPHSHALLVLDQDMPGVDGITLTRRIRENMDFFQVPILLMLSSDENGVREKCREIEAVTLVSKPLKYRDLLEKLVEALGQEFAPSTHGESSAEGTEPRVRVEGARVLVAEDEPINRQAICEIFKASGLEVHAVENGKEVLRALETNPFDAVLLDIQMPIMDGFETTIQIRNDPKFQNLPVFGMSATPSEGVLRAAREVGVDAFLEKPVKSNQFFSLLADCLHSEPAVEQNPEREGAEKFCGTFKGVDLKRVEGIDIVNALGNLGGNSALLLDLIEQFVEKYSSAPQDIRAAIEKEDFSLARSIVHGFRGVSGFLMAHDLQKNIEKVETALLENHEAKVDAALNQMENELNRVLTSASYLEKNKESWTPRKSGIESDPTAGETSHDLCFFFVKLNDLLKENSLDAADCMENIKRIGKKNMPESFQLLEKRINRLEFEEARDELGKIAESLGIHMD